ncbi:ankyrin repeat-containing domain protein [Morchella snyderi]|nr:ankyrin repeat-containing domain protein [Morchella snyderi]
MNEPHKKPRFGSETRKESAAIDTQAGRHPSPTAPPLHVSISSPSLPMNRLAQISEPLPQTSSPSTTSHIRKGLSLLLPYILAHPDITVSFEGARYTLARFQYHSLIYAQALSPCRWLHSHNVWPPMWVTILIFYSLPFATGFSDKSVPPEREDTAPVTASALLLFLPFAILVTIMSYIVELRKTYELPAQAPVLPAPGQCSVEKTLSKAQRSLVLGSPAAAWLLLSVVILILTGLFWRFAESPQGCSTLNPDVAGLGVRVSLWVPATIVMLVAVLGHYHAEETGVKGIAATLLVAQIIYTWNLLMQELGPADKLVGSMILDCLTFLTPITFSMKECLAARQLIRIGYSVQFCSVVVLAKTMTTFHHTGLEQKLTISVESCSCFQAYWWGPFDSCLGPSKTFWMYLVCKAIATIHGAWLCFRYMDHYDSAEKLSCGDSSNAKIKTIGDTVYDSIPATAFTKYRESIAIAISSMVTIEVTLLGFDLPASKDISSWGQTGQILVAVATTSCFTYGFYSMWKNKNVERRQKAIRQCSYGALTPALAIHECDDWSTWVKSLCLIVKDQHPFRFSQLRVVDHCRIQYGSEGWKKITHDCRKFKDLTREELGAMLLDEAKLGDLKTVTELIEDRASVHETDKDGNTALIIAAENNHLTIVELLLQHRALILAQNRRGETALHAAAQAKPCNEDLVRILLEAGSSITIQNVSSETALHCAFQAFKHDRKSHHRLAVCKLLVSKASKAVVSIVGRSGNSSLETDKSRLAIQDSSGNTPLHYAFLHLGGLVFTEAGYEVLRLLLEDSDDPIDIQNKEGMIVLHCAVEGLKELPYWPTPTKNILAVFELLLRTTGSAISLRDSSGSTALHACISSVDMWWEEGFGITKALVETGEISTQNNEGKTVLHCAVEILDVMGVYGLDNDWADAIPVFELLLKNATQAAMSLRDNSGNTPLHAYLLNKHTWWEMWLGITKALVETGDFSIQNNEGKTVLHCAVEMLDVMEDYGLDDWANAIPVFELLLKKATQAAMSLRDNSGNTPLHAYLLNINPWWEEWLGITKALVETGDFSIQNNERKTVLHCAVKVIDEMEHYRFGDEWESDHPINIVFELLSKKVTQAAMSLRDNSGNTPLHAYLLNKHTWSEGWLGITKALVETGDFSIQNNEGKTVLHCAIDSLASNIGEPVDDTLKSFLNVFRFLVGKAGAAVVSIQDYLGNTPLHHAILKLGIQNKNRCLRGVVHLLLEKTIDLGKQNNDGMTTLEALLSVSATGYDERTILDVGIASLNNETLKLLLSRSDLKPVYEQGKTLLHRYLSRHADLDEEVVKILLGISDYSIKNKHGKTALHTAMANRNCPKDVLKVLLGVTRDLTLVDAWGDTFLHCYLRRCGDRDEEVVKLLLEANDNSVENTLGLTFLDVAVRHADIEYGVLKVLLERFELVNYFRVSGGSKITAVLHLAVRERDLKSTKSPILFEVTKLEISGVLCQSPKEVDGYYDGEVPVPPPHGSTCTTNTRAHLHEATVNPGDQKHLGESGIVPTTTQAHTLPFSDKPDQPMLPSISAKSFETSARALLAGTRLEDIPFAATICLRSELATMIDLLHCCNYRIVIQDECGRLLLHTFSPTPQTTAKIIGILLDNSIDINISDGDGQTIPQKAILSRSMELVNVLVNKNRNTSRRDIDDNTFSSDTNNREKKQIGVSASPDKIIFIPNRRILQPKSLRRRLNRNSNNPTSDQV